MEEKKGLDLGREKEFIKLEDFLIEEPILITKNQGYGRIDSQYGNLENEYLKNSESIVKLDTPDYKRVYTIEDEDVKYSDSWLANVGSQGTTLYMDPCQCLLDVGFAIANSNLEIARMKVVSGHMIARSILDMSVNLSSSIEQLSNEIERKNKLDEFYMLINKIEEYEDALIELHCLKEAYETLRISKIPNIYLDDKSICLLLSLEGEMLDWVMKSSKQKCLNPLRCLFHLFSNAVWMGNSLNQSIYLRIEKNNVKVPWISYFNRKTENFGFYNWVSDGYVKVLEKAAFSFSWKSLGIENNSIDIGKCGLKDVIEKKKNSNGETIEESMAMIIIEDKEDTAKRVIEFFYNSITDGSQIYTSKSYNKIISSINDINRDIQLTNLRTLYLELRNAVRRYKIEKELSSG